MEALSLAGRSARIPNGEPAFAAPLNTGIPQATDTGSGSPLSVLVSTTPSRLTSVPSTGDHFTGADNQDIADLHLFDGHLLQAVADSQLSDLWSALHERG
ncbi:MAG: hypothetical protein M3Y09_05810 [Actinomycetota bacterium]|nr:hypothetical protein [Actinomycetota bacterium]